MRLRVGFQLFIQQRAGPLLYAPVVRHDTSITLPVHNAISSALVIEWGGVIDTREVPALSVSPQLFCQVFEIYENNAENM